LIIKRIVAESIWLIRNVKVGGTVGDTLHIAQHVISIVLSCILGYVHNGAPHCHDPYCEAVMRTAVKLIYKT
jgi:hypothetical protein